MQSKFCCSVKASLTLHLLIQNGYSLNISWILMTEIASTKCGLTETIDRLQIVHCNCSFFYYKYWNILSLWQLTTRNDCKNYKNCTGQIISFNRTMNANSFIKRITLKCLFFNPQKFPHSLAFHVPHHNLCFGNFIVNIIKWGTSQNDGLQ